MASRGNQLFTTPVGGSLYDSESHLVDVSRPLKCVMPTSGVVRGTIPVSFAGDEFIKGVPISQATAALLIVSSVPNGGE